MIRIFVSAASAAALAVIAHAPTRADVPATIAVPAQALVATLHAAGAQIYECKAGADGTLSWHFREPIATLFLGDQTVGRHYAGPSWELKDGSAISGKVAARAPARTSADIPLLLLEAVSPRGAGLLADVVAIQRINTRGGIAEGPCTVSGAFHSVPYSADYAFFRVAR